MARRSCPHLVAGPTGAQLERPVRAPRERLERPVPQRARQERPERRDDERRGGRDRCGRDRCRGGQRPRRGRRSGAPRSSAVTWAAGPAWYPGAERFAPATVRPIRTSANSATQGSNLILPTSRLPVRYPSSASKRLDYPRRPLPEASPGKGRPGKRAVCNSGPRRRLRGLRSRQPRIPLFDEEDRFEGRVRDDEAAERLRVLVPEHHIQAVAVMGEHLILVAPHGLAVVEPEDQLRQSRLAARVRGPGDPPRRRAELALLEG